MNIEPIPYVAKGKERFLVDVSVTGPDGRPWRIRRRDFATRRDAIAWGRKAVLQVLEGAPPPPAQRKRRKANVESPTVREVVQDVWEVLKAKWRPATVSQRQYYLPRIVEALGPEKLWMSLTSKDIANVTKLDGKTRVALHRILLRALFREAERQGYSVPDVHIPPGGQLKSKRIAWLTVEEAQALLAHLASPFREAVLLMLYTGLRVGECLALTWRAVDLGAGTLAITRTWNDQFGILEGTKTGKSRLVPLAPPARAVLEKLRPAQVHPDDRVFAIKVCRLQYHIRKAGQEAGISRKVHPHLLRHTCASWLLQNGVDLVVVAQVLGHSTLEMTSHYAHAALGTTQKAVQLLPQLG